MTAPAYKPHYDGFAVVTASTTDTPELRACIESWRAQATYQWPTYHVIDVVGSVPAFARGVREALDGGATLICCLHNDVRIDEPGWDWRVIEHFAAHPRCGLAGFGGALGLGADDIYLTDYWPEQLARRGFLSNLVDAEAHGRRTTQAQRAVCFDGFCQIGTAAFWGSHPLSYIADKGVLHHAYDSWLGAIAARQGWEAWLIPVACQHLGGRTAVGDPAYHAAVADRGGDQGVWTQAHQAMYEDCRGLLPLRVE